MEVVLVNLNIQCCKFVSSNIVRTEITIGTVDIRLKSNSSAHIYYLFQTQVSTMIFKTLALKTRHLRFVYSMDIDSSVSVSFNYH